MHATITNPVNLVLIIIGLFLGITLGLFLLINKSVKSKANIYLGILVLVFSSYFISSFLYRFELSEVFSSVMGISRIFTFLIGPLGYLYVCACTQKGFVMKPILWLHFMPFFIDILWQIPFFTSSAADKITYHEQMLETGDLLFPNWNLLLKAFQGITYFILSARLIFQYKKHLSETASTIDTAFHRWLIVFIIALSSPIIGLFIFVFMDFNALTLRLVTLSIWFFLFAVYIAALVKPELFHAFPHQMLIPDSTEEKKQKYENSSLRADQKEKMVKVLLKFVTAQKPFLEPELTLAQLSDKVNIPAHYLSQVINEKLHCNFLDFINSYRVKEAQAKLIDPRLSHYTIISIAYEAGFNSKSTFYTAFKKATNMTPSQYRKQATNF